MFVVRNSPDRGSLPGRLKIFDGAFYQKKGSTSNSRRGCLDDSFARSYLCPVIRLSKAGAGSHAALSGLTNSNKFQQVLKGSVS